MVPPSAVALIPAAALIRNPRRSTVAFGSFVARREDMTGISLIVVYLVVPWVMLVPASASRGRGSSVRTAMLPNGLTEGDGAEGFGRVSEH